MAANWTRVNLPPLERVALAGLAEKRGESDGITLVRLIREAVQRELARDEATPITQGQPAQQREAVHHAAA